MCSANSTARHQPFIPSPAAPSKQPHGRWGRPSTHFQDEEAEGSQGPLVPSPQLTPCTRCAPQSTVPGGLGEESVVRCVCPTPASWLPPLGQPICSASMQRTTAGRWGPTCSGGDAQEPAGVFQPRPEHLQLHGAGARAVAQQGGQQRLWPKMLSDVLCPGRLWLPAWGPRALGPCCPKPVPATAAWSRCEWTHLPAGCLCLCQALGLIITLEKCPHCFQWLPWPQWQPEIRPIRAGLEAGSLELAISCFWLGGGSQLRSQPGLFHPGQLRDRPTWTSGRGVWGMVSGGGRVQVRERCVSKSTAETPSERSSQLPHFGISGIRKLSSLGQVWTLARNTKLRPTSHGTFLYSRRALDM